MMNAPTSTLTASEAVGEVVPVEGFVTAEATAGEVDACFVISVALS